MRLIGVMVSISLVVMLAGLALGMGQTLQSAVSMNEKSYAAEVARSTIAYIMAQPYGNREAYEVGAVANPKEWPVTVKVLYYSPSGEPSFGEDNPDLGLQKIVVRVTDSKTSTSYTAEALKAR